MMSRSLFADGFHNSLGNLGSAAAQGRIRPRSGPSGKIRSLLSHQGGELIITFEGMSPNSFPIIARFLSSC